MNDTLIELINDLDEDVSVIRGLSGLAGLLDGNPEYHSHTILLLHLCGDAANRVELNLRNLTSYLHAIEGE
jgi:hypothetical protein